MNNPEPTNPSSAASGRPRGYLCVKSSILHGAWAFAVVSLAGFSVWAFAGKWLYKNVGEAGLYVVSAMVFVGLAGLLLHPLVHGERPMARFYKAFVPAFLVYAFAWSVCWFVWGFGPGEWLGSFAGCALFTFVLKLMFGVQGRPGNVVLVLFLTHSAGYFAGDLLYKALAHPPLEVAGLTKAQVALAGRLGWGLCYGLGFGAGIGYAFSVLQRLGNQAGKPGTQ